MTAAAAVLKACLAIIFREIWSRDVALYIFLPFMQITKKLPKWHGFSCMPNDHFHLIDWLEIIFSVFQFFNPLVVNRSTQSGYSNQDQFCQLRHDYALFLIEIFEWVWWLFKFWWIFTNLKIFLLKFCLFWFIIGTFWTEDIKSKSRNLELIAQVHPYWRTILSLSRYVNCRSDTSMRPK